MVKLKITDLGLKKLLILDIIGFILILCVTLCSLILSKSTALDAMSSKEKLINILVVLEIEIILGI